MKSYLIIIFLFCFKIISSQIDSSKAVIYIKQKDAIIYLDGKKIQSQKELRKITVGKHYIKAWAPKHELILDSFLVKKNENKFYSKSLPYTEDYKIYKSKKTLKFLTYSIPAVLAIGFGITYDTRYKSFSKKINQTRSDAIEIQNQYNNSFSPAEFTENYNNYYQKVDDYKTLQNKQSQIRKQGIIFTSVLGGTALTVFVIQMLRKKVPYNETPLLTRVVPGFNPLNKQICLTINMY